MDCLEEGTQPLLSNTTNASTTDYYTMGKDGSDPMVRDKKALPLSGFWSVLPSFLSFLFIVTPLWLFVLVPITLIFQLFIKLYQVVCGSKPKVITTTSGELETLNQLIDQRPDPATRTREFDLVVFGTTGFTGKMVAIYIAKRYGASFKWAIAGRRRDALEQIRDELTLINNDLRNLPIVIADSSDAASLDAMTGRTKVVITTAGPFSRYGSALVKWCAVNGTHYCDITGETDWVREMIDKYDTIARKTGARIVSFCGHDCIPWDLAVLECAKQLKKKGETITEIHFYDEINSAPSGGTLDTALSILTSRVVYKSLLGFDPLLKSTNGEKSTHKFISQNQSFLGYSSEFQSWTGFFVMAMVMANCVRRSNAINNYSTKLVYKEAAVHPSFMAAFITQVGFLVFGTALYCPPLKSFLQTCCLPKPGQGPSEASMDEGFLRVTGIATGSNGGKARAVFYFPTDPGYRDTARMLVESGLVLALQGDKVKVSGGVWTPATCQGDLLTKRLIDTGSSLSVE
jgi:short subunit dehydrogenase-like uncharacterized protein